MHHIFPTISVTLSAFWLLGDLAVFWLYVTLIYSFLCYITFPSLVLNWVCLFPRKKLNSFVCTLIIHAVPDKKDPVLFFQCHSNSWEFLTQFFSRLGIRYRWVILFFGKYANVCHLCSCFSLMCVNICVPT